MTDAPTHQIVIDLNRECTQKQYADRARKTLQQVSNEINAGKLHVREIPELGLRLVQIDAPLFNEGAEFQSTAPLYTYNGKDLAFFLSKVLNDYVRMGQDWEKMEGERNAAVALAESLQNEVNSLHETVNQLHKTVNEVNSQNEVIKRANGDLSSQLGEARAKNRRMSSELTAAQNEQKRLREQAATLEQAREEQDNTVRVLQEENKGLVDQLHAVQGEMKEQLIRASHQEQERARAEQEVHGLAEARVRLEGEVAVLQQEKEEFTATRKELIQRAEAAEKEVITLQERIKAAGQLNPEEHIKQLTEIMREEVARQVKTAVRPRRSAPAPNAAEAADGQEETT